jgi:hypothetical protein
MLWGGWVPMVSQGDIEFRSHVGLISQQMNTSKVASSSELRATLADLVMVKPGYLYYQALLDIKYVLNTSCKTAKTAKYFPGSRIETHKYLVWLTKFWYYQITFSGYQICSSSLYLLKLILISQLKTCRTNI